MHNYSNSKRTKKAIEGSFISLLAKMDCDKITINHIIEDSEVTRSTFYRYYENKYDLAKSILLNHVNGIMKILLDKKLDAKTIRESYDYLHNNKNELKSIFKIKSSWFDPNGTFYSLVMSYPELKKRLNGGLYLSEPEITFGTLVGMLLIVMHDYVIVSDDERNEINYESFHSLILSVAAHLNHYFTLEE